MPAWPRWLLDPEHPDAPLDATAELHRLHTLRELARRVGRDPSALTPAELSDLAEELAGDLEALAIVQGNALEHAARLERLWDQSVVVQARQISQTPYWAYHPEKFASWREFLRAKCAREPGKARYLEWICEVAIPWMEAHGYQDAVRHMWSEDTIGKTKLMVDKVRAEFKGNGIRGESDAGKPLSPELHARLDAMLADLADPAVDAAAFEARYRRPLPQARTETPAIQGYEFLAGDGAVLVLVCTDPAQIDHAKLALKADWHLGTGREPWLARLGAGRRPSKPVK